MEEDLQEWEMLHNPETDLVDSSSLPGIEGDSPKSLIRSDYFALQSNSNHVMSDLGAEAVVSHQQDIGFEEEESKQVDLIGIEGGSEVPVEIKDFEGSENDYDEIEVRESPVSVEGSNDGVSEMVNSEDQLVSANNEHASESADININKKMMWWKHPFELLKFCVFRVSPVWTFSIAAAVVGILILKKRLSRMKQKSRSIPIKLTVEDKKVSQFMVRAARLNEAFSVVRRVPIIRPILPSGGVTPWPALNLR